MQGLYHTKLGKKWEVPVHKKKGKIVDFSKEAKCCLTGWVIMLYTVQLYKIFEFQKPALWNRFILAIWIPEQSFLKKIFAKFVS